MCRRFLTLILLTILSIPPASAELPEIDTAPYCMDKVHRWKRGNLDWEKQFWFCMQTEFLSVRDVRWRLGMLPEDLRERCIAKGLEEGSYSAIERCLDRVSLPLRR
jgi:hypothetical protein